jgi:hypothetical protein
MAVLDALDCTARPMELGFHEGQQTQAHPRIAVRDVDVDVDVDDWPVSGRFRNL